MRVVHTEVVATDDVEPRRQRRPARFEQGQARRRRASQAGATVSNPQTIARIALEAPRRRDPVQRQFLRRGVMRSLLPIGLGACLLSVGGIAVGSPASADEPSTPGHHVLSTQNVCDLVWPGSAAQPNPAKFGAACVRSSGLMMRLAKAFPAFASNLFVLDPGSAPELPIGSARINPSDPISDWVIPDCYVQNRVDCAKA
jgi:hypothetical protein